MPVGQRVNESAAELLLPQRIAERVHHRARREPSRRNVPELLQAERELLRLPLLAQRQATQELFCQVAADTVAEDRHLRQDVDARFEGRFLLAMLADAAIARAHANHARAIHQDVLRRESGEQVDAFRLDLSGQPADEVIERDDVVAVILERGRDDREWQLRLRRQKVDMVLVDLGRQRSALFLEVRDQVAQRGGVKDGAREHVRRRLARLLEDGNRQRLATLLLLDLREAKRRREPGRAAADDQNINFERLAIHGIADYPFSSSAVSAGAISNRSPTMP